MISRHVAQTAFIDFADLEFQWQWLHATLNNTPDLYLDELREELKEECGVSVSLSTIWRALV
jgi:transposase